jgi:VWFA-related protein
MRTLLAALMSVVAGLAVLSGLQEPARIRTDVNLVQLHVLVTDGEGRNVAGLGKDAFRLFVDDAPMEITVFEGEDAPVTAGIVVDNSASMAGKRQEVIAAALAFARASNPKDQMFVVHFNDAARLGLPDGKPFTADIGELESAIAAFRLGGTTALYDALLTAESHFQSAAFPRKVLLTVSDGGDNSSRATLAMAVSGARDFGIVLYPIGIFDEGDRDRNPAVLEKLAEQTGGRAFFPEHVSGITEVCIRIAKEIREAYTLGFNGGTDGRYHRLRLAVGDGKRMLKAHTRAGYIAMPPSGSAPQQ